MTSHTVFIQIPCILQFDVPSVFYSIKTCFINETNAKGQDMINYVSMANACLGIYSSSCCG
jgi:hypothetical protein